MNGHRSNFARHTSAAIVALIAGLAALSLPLGNLAWAQTSGFKAADSHAVIVTADKVSLRCGASDFHYKIGDAAKGAILKADGEDGPWTRVTLPAIIHAFVKAEQANLVGDSVEGQLADLGGLFGARGTDLDAFEHQRGRTACDAGPAYVDILRRHHLLEALGDDVDVLGACEGERNARQASRQDELVK